MNPSQTYQTAVKDLNSLQISSKGPRPIKVPRSRHWQYGMSEFAAFFEKLGYRVSDLNRLNVIHVTGTKGKGSTCAFVSSLLRNLPNNKLKVGLYTSPHLIEVRERIQIDGRAISQKQFTQYFYQVYGRLKSSEPPLRMVTPESPLMPKYFRFLTLMAYHAFLSEKVDVAIMEVGVGGQYDSTNLIEQPAVCGIASLGIDHKKSLGGTIESIAWHKGGIIKRKVPVFTVEQAFGALEVLEQRAAENEAPLRVIAPLDNIKLGISGKHQKINAALAVALCKEWISRTNCFPDTIAEDSQWIRDGLGLAKWPGRSQTFISKALDAGCQTTVKSTINKAVEYIEQTYGDQEVHVLVTGSLHLVGGVLDVAKGSI